MLLVSRGISSKSLLSTVSASRWWQRWCHTPSRARAANCSNFFNANVISPISEQTLRPNNGTAASRPHNNTVIGNDSLNNNATTAVRKYSIRQYDYWRQQWKWIFNKTMSKVTDPANIMATDFVRTRCWETELRKRKQQYCGRQHDCRKRRGLHQRRWHRE